MLVKWPAVKRQVVKRPVVKRRSDGRWSNGGFQTAGGQTAVQRQVVPSPVYVAMGDHYCEDTQTILTRLARTNAELRKREQYR